MLGWALGSTQLADLHVGRPQLVGRHGGAEILSVEEDSREEEKEEEEEGSRRKEEEEKEEERDVSRKDSIF